MTEHAILNEVLGTLGRLRWCRVWRQNAGAAISIDGMRKIRLAVPGAADITGILPDGRRLEVEVKTQTGRQSDQQRAFQRMIENLGGVYILVRSSRDALDQLAALGYRDDAP